MLDRVAHLFSAAFADDTLHVVDLDYKLQGAETAVGGYDLVWCGGPVKVKRPHTANGFIGTGTTYFLATAKTTARLSLKCRPVLAVCPAGQGQGRPEPW